MNGRRFLAVGLVMVVALALALSGLALARSSHDEAQGLVVGGIDTSGKYTTQQVLNGEQQTGLTVSGTGQVFAKPDIAVVTLGVQAEAKTVANAQQQANQAMSAVMSALTANGIADKDVRTTSFSIQPVWNYTENQRVLEGYQVNNIVSVIIRDVNKTGAIIDAVTVAGGDLTRVENISFTVENPKPYNDQARELAIKDAIDKAQQIARLAGVSLGKIIYISESGGGVPAPVAFDQAATSVTPISSGQLEINISVQVVYALQ